MSRPTRWLMAFAATVSPAGAATAFPTDAGGTRERVIVTATLRSEDLAKIASSVGVMTQEQMSSMGVKDFGEAVRFVPGVSFDPLSNSVAIRGISSGAGAGTTGIYIDDVPIQIRSLDYNSNNTLPATFDLERVEVLRGPQGTLFGAGSEGGALRYISAQPNLEHFEGQVRAESSVGRNGSWNYEAGAAVSGPLRDDLALRVSGWARHEGGTVDKFDVTTGETTRRNANATDTYAARGVVLWTPFSGLTLTASDFYQNRIKHDTDSFWVADPSHRNGTPESLNDGDHFNVATLKAEYDLGATQLISNTSYFSRQQRVRGYSGTVYNLSYFQQLTAAGTDPMGNPCTAGQCASGLYPLLTTNGFNLPGFGPYQAIATVTNKQNNFAQEVRLQSSDPEARLVWLVGAFWALNTQHSVDAVFDPQLADMTQYLWGLDMVDAWGVDLPANGADYINDTIAHDSQLAVFVNASVAVTDTVKLQAGARYAQTRFDFRNYSDGPENFGYQSGIGKQSESPVTYMGSLIYSPTDRDMLYASYATGYRIGGANQPFPEASCQADLDALGLTGGPRAFNSDEVTSFELGSKNRFLDDRLQLQTSVYRSSWSRMQQTNYLSSCGFQYVANFGSATSTGFDLQADWVVTDALQLHATAGYTDAHFTRDSRSGPAEDAGLLARRGDALPGAPWTFSIVAAYSFRAVGHTITAQLDYEYASKITRFTPQTDAATNQYDPGLVNDPPTGIASFRLQTTIRQLTVTAFVENLFDSQPRLGLSHEDRYTALYEAWTLRPRTVGLSLARRF